MTQPSSTRSGAAAGRLKVSRPSTDQSPRRSWSGAVSTGPLNSMMPAMAHSLVPPHSAGAVTRRRPSGGTW